MRIKEFIDCVILLGAWTYSRATTLMILVALGELTSTLATKSGASGRSRVDALLLPLAGNRPTYSIRKRSVFPTIIHLVFAGSIPSTIA